MMFRPCRPSSANIKICIIILLLCFIWRLNICSCSNHAAFAMDSFISVVIDDAITLIKWTYLCFAFNKILYLTKALENNKWCYDIQLVPRSFKGGQVVWEERTSLQLDSLVDLHSRQQQACLQDAYQSILCLMED